MLVGAVFRFAKRSAARLFFYATLLRLLISVARKRYRADYLAAAKLKYDSISECQAGVHMQGKV
jgi:hypothetical protein